MKKQTYAESCGCAPFDWNAALANPPEKYSEEHTRLIDLSADWVTCACGNQCDIIPRYKSGAPMDEYLRYLGDEFDVKVRLADWCEAIDTLENIEERSGEIITETKAGEVA